MDDHTMYMCMEIIALINLLWGKTAPPPPKKKKKKDTPAPSLVNAFWILPYRASVSGRNIRPNIAPVRRKIRPRAYDIRPVIVSYVRLTFNRRIKSPLSIIIDAW